MQLEDKGLMSVDDDIGGEGSDDDDVGASITLFPPSLEATATTAATATSLQRRQTLETMASSTLEVHALCRNHVNATRSPSISMPMMVLMVWMNAVLHAATDSIQYQ